MNDTVSDPTSKQPTTPLYSILETAHALEAKLETVLDEAGLSGAKFSVLSELVRSGEALPLSELAARLSCVRSNMTQLVDRLESDGLVRRVACPTDRRSVKAEITEEGTRRQADGAKRVGDFERGLAERVSDLDELAIDRVMRALR
jgi:DNA-binding MarR family transcriptional regulator